MDPPFPTYSDIGPDKKGKNGNGSNGQKAMVPGQINPNFIRTIEWEMMDKRKFFPMSMASSFTVRCFLYPLTLVRTRLQVQYHTDLYTGTFDAFRKIVRSEGVRGLYRGFWVSAFQVIIIFLRSTFVIGELLNCTNFCMGLPSNQ